MALSTAQQASRLFKLIFRKAERDITKDFFEENTNTYPAVYPSDIWIDEPSIPTTAPGTSGIAGIINYVGNLTLIGTPVYPNSFTHPSLSNVIPFNYGDGSYNYTLQTQGGTPIPFGTGDWLLDTESGVLTFYNGLPSGVSSSVPPVLSFYQYAGAQNTGVVFINATGTNNYASTYPLQSLSKNVMYITQFQNTNTGASTLNINGLGGKTIKTLTVSSPGFLDDTPPGALNTAGFTILAYDGTHFQIINSSAGLNSNNTYTQLGNSFGTSGILGTTDNNALTFITNKSERMRIGATGNFLFNSQTNDNISTYQINAPTSISKLSITGDGNGEATVSIKNQTRYTANYNITIPSTPVIGDTISVVVSISGTPITLATYTVTSTSINAANVATALYTSINASYRVDQWQSGLNSSTSLYVRAPIGTASVASAYTSSLVTTGTSSVTGTTTAFAIDTGTIFMGVGGGGLYAGGQPFIQLAGNGLYSGTNPVINTNGVNNYGTFQFANGGNSTTILGNGGTNLSVSWGNWSTGGGVAPTSGEVILLQLYPNNGNVLFNPATGNGALSTLKIISPIAQATGTTGITRGIYIAPTLGRAAASAGSSMVITNAGTSGCVLNAIVTVSGTPTTVGSYTVTGGDTTTTVATGLKNAINAATLTNGGYTSTSSGTTVSINATPGTSGNGAVLSYTFDSPGAATIQYPTFGGGYNTGYAVNWRGIQDDSSTGYSYYQTGAAKNYFQGNTSIGGTAAATGAALTINGNVSMGHLIGTLVAPTYFNYTGSIASASIIGDDLGGIITITSVASGVMNLNVSLLQVYFNTSFAIAPSCIILNPANSAAANAANSGAMPYINYSSIATSGFLITSSPVNALSLGTTYQFYYFIKQ